MLSNNEKIQEPRITTLNDKRKHWITAAEEHSYVRHNRGRVNGI